MPTTLFCQVRQQATSCLGALCKLSRLPRMVFSDFLLNYYLPFFLLGVSFHYGWPLIKASCPGSCLPPSWLLPLWPSLQLAIILFICLFSCFQLATPSSMLLVLEVYGCEDHVDILHYNILSIRPSTVGKSSITIILIEWLSIKKEESQINCYYHFIFFQEFKSSFTFIEHFLVANVFSNVCLNWNTEGRYYFHFTDIIIEAQRGQWIA